ncbi:MAG TPA: hypothetical protein VGO57_11220 [Verrucomicrobiae bacterium]|jgi:hypothetical protein
MSATELIEEIKLLPREEQERISAFIQNLMANNQALRAEPNVQYMDAGKAKALSAEIFSKHTGLFRKLAS